MDISRSSTFTILYGGRSLLTPSYFLLRWTWINNDTPTYCICTNVGNDAGPILLQVTETGAVTPDPFSAEVQLGSGDHFLEVWEQDDPSNLFPPDAEADYSELVRVADSALPPPDPVDPCLGCGDDLCATVNAANSSDVIACVVENGDVPVYLCGFIATDEATADIGVECIGNAGKTADYQALLCPPCDPLSIAINGVAAFDVTDPCGNVYDIPIADSNGSIVPVTIVGDQVRVDDLPCAPCDPLSINVNGVEYGTVTDPCGGVAIVDVVNDLLAAVGSLVGGVWKIAKSRIYATDGVTLVQSIQPETNFSLPQSTIKYTDASNVAQVTAPSDTEFSTTLRPATLVPRRQILNTAGNPANSTFADLDDLISGTMPVAQDASIQRKDSASANIGLPISAPSNATTNMTCPDATVQLKDSAGTNIGSADSYKSNSSNNKTAPDGTVTINNSVPTTLHTVAVKSNGSVTQAIADSTITKPDGTTVGLPATVALDVRTYKSGIAYPYGRAQWSGQTTVHRTGDEGTWLADGLFDHFNPVYPDHYATLTNITTLASNNIYGNTLRFTDRTGAAAATSGNRVIQDHLTGIEWYIPSSLPAATTWNNAIDAAESSSVESSTDWHIPPFKVMATITRMDQTAPLNYGGFLVTVDVWTSTTNPDVTTAALRCTASTNGTFPSVAKSTNNSYIYCRKFI